MVYTEKQIELLSLSLMGDKIARKELTEKCEPLEKLESALAGKKEAIEWLLQHDKMLAAFDDAVGGNRSALRLLVKKKEFGWAAVANYINGDDDALLWLKKQGLGAFVKLAHGIRELQKHESSKNVSLLFKP